MRKCVVEHDNKLYYCNVIKEKILGPKKKGIFLLEFNEELPLELQKTRKLLWKST